MDVSLDSRTLLEGLLQMSIKTNNARQEIEPEIASAKVQNNITSTGRDKTYIEMYVKRLYCMPLLEIVIASTQTSNVPVQNRRLSMKAMHSIYPILLLALGERSP